MMNEKRQSSSALKGEKVHGLKRARRRPFQSQQPHKGIVDKIQHNYVNRSALMLTDDPNVLLISQLMERHFIECLFLHVSEMRQMDAPVAFAWDWRERGRGFWARKRSWENLSSGTRRNKMQLRVAPFEFLGGISLLLTSSAVQLHLLPLKVLRASFTYRVFASHRIPIY
jgi:hypothetical protein